MSKNKKKIDTDSVLEGLDLDNLSPENIVHSQVSKDYPSPKPLDLPAERVMSGRREKEPTKKRTMVLELDPGICRRWRYYDRFEEWFSYENCQDLIDDMRLREQEIPGIVRKLENDLEGYEYEVVFGGRRHFSAEYITEHDGQVKPFKAILRDISDQEAARLMDLENRKRADISDFERCVSYRQQLGKTPGYEPIFKTLNELRAAIESDKGDSEAVKGKQLTKAGLSQMVTAAELNEIDVLINLFRGRRIHIPWSHAYNVMMLWNSEEDGVREAIVDTANRISKDASRKTPEQILKELLIVAKEGRMATQSFYKEDIKLNGKIAVKASASARDLSLKIPLKVLDSSDEDELLDLVKQAMKNVRL
jgi:ParB/RepB/Spo0J family partition protein